MAIEVREYLAANGKAPFSQWLSSLHDRKTRVRILMRLNRVRLGNFGDCKSIGEGLFELRMTFGPGYRVYFARAGKEIILLLGGGDKNTQSKDIENAKAAWADFQK